MAKVRVGDIDMCYETYGEGEPLLLIAGLSADLSSWILQVMDFSKEYRVITFDNRGTGRTDAPDTPYSIEMMADDAAGLMDALNIERAHVLGVSMGGCIGQELALKYPYRVRSLVLAATLARPYARSSYILRTLSKMNREGISRESHVRLQLFWLFTAKFFENPDQVQMVIDGMLANPCVEPAYAYDRKLDAVEGFDTRQRLHEITAPTLVLVGKEDILTPLVLSEEIAAGIPNAELVILDGGGHAFSGEIWQEFNQTVLGFLAKQT